jgi:hypothetical protein
MRNREQLEVIFDLNSLSDAAALQMVVDVMKKLGLPDTFEFDATSVGRDEFLSRVKRTGRWSFEVCSGGLAFRFGVVSQWSHSFVHVSEQEIGSAKSWDEWVAPFAMGKGFVQAWVSDVDFDYWQNAQDVMLYEHAQRDYAGLPIVSNGLPPPLQQNVIDISGNPGRRVIRDGYVESVGLRMWLGRSFWERVGERMPERVATAGWATTDLGNDITLLETEEFRAKCTTPTQIALRSAIYARREGQIPS